MTTNKQKVEFIMFMVLIVCMYMISFMAMNYEYDKVMTTESMAQTAIVETDEKEGIGKSEMTFVDSIVYERGNTESLVETSIRPETIAETTVMETRVEKEVGSTVVGVTEASSGSVKLLFAQVVAAEAHPRWDFEGYYVIARTIMNQLETGAYGNSIEDVIKYPGNYSVYSNGRYLKVDVDWRAEQAVDYVMSGKEPDTLVEAGITDVDKVLFFCTAEYLNSNPSCFHSTQTRLFQYDNVVFFAKSK